MLFTVMQNLRPTARFGAGLIPDGRKRTWSCGGFTD